MNLLLKSAAALLLCAVASGASAQSKTIKIATAAPEGTNWMKEIRVAAEAVKTRTQGRVELKYYPGGVMGNDAAVLRKIKLGQLQGGAFTGAELSQIYKDAPIYSLPFRFRDQGEVDYARRKMDDDLRRGLQQSGMVAIGMAGGGFVYLMGTKPIKTRDELRASKVWAPQSDRIAQVALQAGGVEPVLLPLSDVYTALQTGLVETVANTLSGSIAFQWHTKVKYVVDLPLTYVVGMMVVDNKAYDALAPEDQKALSEEMQKAFDRLDGEIRKDNEAARATLVKQGIQFLPPGPGEIAYWAGIGEESAKRLNADKAFTPEMYQKLVATIAEYRAQGGGDKPK
jgi:TRAP-type C4-dicarboxylate transport system substrate-binding protein